MDVKWRELDPSRPQAAVHAASWTWQELPIASLKQDEWDASCAELGIQRDASREEVQAAYRAMVLQHHPDRARPVDRAAAEDRMKRINVAHRFLLDRMNAAKKTAQA